MALSDFDSARIAEFQSPGGGASADSPEQMSRREAIRRAAALLGGVIFAPTLASALQGCTARPGAFTPKALSSGQLAMVNALSDTILPRTDTPSATEAGVPAFIDEMLARNYSEADREQMLADMDAFAERAAADLGMEFTQAGEAERAAYLTERLREELDAGRTGFALRIKQAVMLGYFTSEAGATQVLRYIAIPGKQEGCIPFEQVGRTWAT